ncbi:MAG: hypothetical protein QM500_10695, partial [Methylococcales bacterium]
MLAFFLYSLKYSLFNPFLDYKQFVFTQLFLQPPSDRAATVKLAETPNLFAEIRQPSTSYIAIPTVSSERRKYLTVGFLDEKTIASNQIYIVPNANLFHFGLLSSYIHMLWVRAVCGQLETRIRYSAAICYNNFPIELDLISDELFKDIEGASLDILSIRESYPDKTLAKLYDPELMPDNLVFAHGKLDKLVNKIYSKSPINSDEESIQILFDLYEKMTGVGQNA